MRKENIKIKCPKHILFGDPMYFDYFTPRDPERNPVPLHWFSFANHRFAFGIHPYVLLFNLAQYSRMFILPVSIQ